MKQAKQTSNHVAKRNCSNDVDNQQTNDDDHFDTMFHLKTQQKIEMLV